MMTWTVNSLAGHYLNAVAVVSADDVETAINLLQKELKLHGLEQVIIPGQLIPMVTTTRKARILFDGYYQ